MRTPNIYKYIEFFSLFVLIPLSYAFPYSLFLKAGIGVLGFVYVLFVLIRVEGVSLKLKQALDWNLFWKQTVAKLIIIAIGTSSYVFFTEREALFQVVLNQPLKWLTLLFIYSCFSVYPQELLYRTFFFTRYAEMFKTTSLLICINATVFALGHLFFKSTLVLVLTSIGGLLFALTYVKTKSTFLVTIEHALYGSWLFTVGMGQMLGFPV